MIAEEAGLQRPALYNPALWSRAEVRAYFIARQALLDRLLDDFRREKQGTRPQHRLILGQRGMGKSTLLRRLAIGVEDDPELAGQWLPLIFPEEQYNVATLADFWLNCLDALADVLEARGDAAAVQAIDAEVERLDRKDGEGALQALLRAAGKLKRRLLLLVDNIDLILERLKDKDWVLREALQGHPELLLVGASSRGLEATYDYGAAFYDFFRIDELRGLSENEMRDTIVALARRRGAADVVRRIEADPGRLRVLHTLTGGNPRTAVLLYGVLLKGVEGDVRSDLEGLLDEVTPLYKARFDELPAQAQQLLDKVALHWDPISARQAADALGWSVNLASAQLDRLVQAGVLEKVKAGRGRRMAFQVAERFFNIWYLMRASRRVRRKLMWLVEFLRACFSLEELRRQAERLLPNRCAETANAEYALALGRAIGPSPLTGALEIWALDSLLANGTSRLEDMFDARGEDKDLASRAEQIQARLGLRREFGELLKGVEGGDEILEDLLGLPDDTEALVGLLDELKLSDEGGLDKLRDFVAENAARQRRYLGNIAYEQLRRALAAGHMAGMGDVEGGEAAAIRYEQPLLAWAPLLFNHTERERRHLDMVDVARRYLEIDASGSVAWFALGMGLSGAGSEQEAIDALRKAAEINPFDLKIVRTLAWRLMEQGGVEREAAECFSRILEQVPDDANARRGLALVLIDEPGRRSEAIDMIRLLCHTEPDKALNWRLLAGVLVGQEAYQAEQLQAARQAVALAPEKTPSVWMLANSLLYQRQFVEGLAVVRQWFARLAEQDEITPQDVTRFCSLARNAFVHGIAPDLLRDLDASGLADRLRPAREALAAAAAGDAELLNGVAPEVRKPARVLLALIDPALADGAAPSASL